MAHFLLIHGSWHGAWCWYKIAPRLRAHGHRVTAPDLPGRRHDRRLTQFINLSYIANNVSRYLPSDQKTTIVVHSRYGVLASRLAEMFPERIARTIYLASYMLPTDRAAASYFRADKGSLLQPYVTISKTGLWDFLDPAIYRDALYHDCSDDDNMLGCSLLCHEPLRPAIAKNTLTDANYGQVPRAYIRLTEDRAVTPMLQDRVINESGVDRVEEIAASHSAYFSKPDELTDVILKLSQG